MDKTTRALGWLGITALVAMLSTIAVMLGPSAAHALGNGCPPQSSICNPATLATLAAEGDTALLSAIGVTDTAIAGTSGLAATTTATAGGTGVAVTAGSALLVGAAGTYATNLLVSDPGQPGGLATVPEVLPGWISPNPSVFGPVGEQVTLAANVLSYPEPGEVGPVVVAWECLGLQYYYSYTPYLKIWNNNGTYATTYAPNACTSSSLGQVFTVSRSWAGDDLAKVGLGDNRGYMEWLPPLGPGSPGGFGWRAGGSDGLGGDLYRCHRFELDHQRVRGGRFCAARGPYRSSRARLSRGHGPDAPDR